jgi:hypothetical protein
MELLALNRTNPGAWDMEVVDVFGNSVGVPTVAKGQILICKEILP